MQQVGDILFQLRMKRGLTQRELSRLVDVPQPNLSNIEKGKQDVTVSTLQRIAAVLGCALSDFFKEVEKQPPEVSMTRERIERLAEAIVNGQTPRASEDAEIVKLFRDMRPQPRGRMRIGQTYQSWRKLRGILPKQVIYSLHARVRDAEIRSQESTAHESR